MRTLTRISRVPPTRLKLRVSRTRSSLGWTRKRHFADLVKEHRAPVRHLEEPLLPLPRIGEGAALVAEHLAFEQRLGR